MEYGGDCSHSGPFTDSFPAGASDNRGDANGVRNSSSRVRTNGAANGVSGKRCQGQPAGQQPGAIVLPRVSRAGLWRGHPRNGLFDPRSTRGNDLHPAPSAAGGSESRRPWRRSSLVEQGAASVRSPCPDRVHLDTANRRESTHPDRPGRPYIAAAPRTFATGTVGQRRRPTASRSRRLTHAQPRSA